MNSNAYSRAKRPRSRLFLAAIVTGLLAAALSYFWLAQQNHKGQATQLLMQNVVMAARDIPPRTPVTPDMLITRSVPIVQVPDGAISVSTEALGKVTTRPIGLGQCIRADMVIQRGPTLGLAYTLEPHKRAVCVAIDSVGGVAGLLSPGDHVDVVTTYVNATGDSVVRTVLQNMTLLALDSQTVPSPPAATTNGETPPAPAAGTTKLVVATTATLMASPQEAEILVLAATRGHIHLTLRAVGDNESQRVFELHSYVGTVRRPTPYIAPIAASRPVVAAQPAKPTATTGSGNPATSHERPLPSITVIKGTDVKSISVKQ